MQCITKSYSAKSQNALFRLDTLEDLLKRNEDTFEELSDRSNQDPSYESLIDIKNELALLSGKYVFVFFRSFLSFIFVSLTGVELELISFK